LWIVESNGSSCSGFSLHESFDTVDHILDKALLGFSESPSVGDIVDTVISLGVLSMNTSLLDIVLIADSVDLRLILGQLWKSDMHGSSHGSTKVGWARGNVTEMLVMSEFANSFNVLGCSAESFKDFSDSGTVLHGNDSQLILLVDPDKESLGFIVEDTSSRWPVSVETA